MGKVTLGQFLNKSFLAAIRIGVLMGLLAGCATVNVSKQATNLAESHIKKGEYDLAIIEAKKAIEADPINSGEAWFWLGGAYYKKGKIEPARNAFNKALGFELSNSFRMETYYYLGKTYQLNDFDKAIDCYNNALELAPRFLAALNSRGYTYLFKGMYEGALRDFRRVIESELTNKGVKTLRYAYVGEAFVFLGLGDKEKTLTMIRKAKEVDPSYNSNFHLGLVYYAAGNERELKKLFGDTGYLGVRVSPYNKGSVKALLVGFVEKEGPAEKGGLLKGDLIIQMNDIPTNDSRKFVERIHSMTPGSSAHLKILRGGEEIKLNIVLGRKSHKETLARMESNRLISPILAKKKVYQAAQEAAAKGELRKALHVYMDYFESANGRPLDYELVERIVRLAREIDPPPAIPEEARRHAVRAQAFLKSASKEEDFEKAFDDFEKAIRLSPWWVDLYLNYGLAQEGGGNYDRAIQSFNLFLIAAPHDPAARDVRNKIYALEAEAEKAAKFKRWEGRWIYGAGDTCELKVHGEKVELVYVQVPSSMYESGYRAGDVFFNGTIIGSEANGKKLQKTDDLDESRCFGKSYYKDATLSLSPDGNRLTMRFDSIRFLIKSCEVIKYTPKKYVFDRAP